jgi:hypothetical protein
MTDAAAGVNNCIGSTFDQVTAVSAKRASRFALVNDASCNNVQVWLNPSMINKMSLMLSSV